MNDPITFVAYLLGFIVAACILGGLAELLPHTPDRDDFESEDELP